MPKAPTQPTLLAATFPAETLDFQPLTASAERVNADQSSKYRRLSQQWQIESFGFYRTLGECWYPAQFYAHSIPLVRFYAGIRDSQGNVEELGPDDWASEQLDRIQDPGGGRSTLLSAYGRLNFLIGDGYLVGSIEDDEEGWEFLSPSELRAIPGTNKFARVGYPGATPEELTTLPDDAYEPLDSGIVVYRIWNRDPEYTMLADSPIRAVLPLYGQLLLAQQAVDAKLRSRIANVKILLLSSDISFGAPDGQNTDAPSADAFNLRLQQTMVRPIKQPGSASAVAPPILRVPGQMIADKSVYDLIDLTIPETYEETQLRDEIRNRIALGLDMPAEIMLGLADSNHWNAFQIDEASWNAHLKPVVVRLCDDLGRAFLRPLAKQEGKQYPKGQLVVWFDESEVVNHPNRTEDVRLAWQDGVAGGAIYRETIGITEEDAPTEADREVWTIKYGRGRPEDLSLVDGQPVTNPGSQPAVTDTPAKDTARNPGAPSQENLDNQPSNVTASAVLSGFEEQAVGAAQLAVIRCRTLAGSRLRTRLKASCPDVANALVASTIGLELLPVDPSELVASGADDFREFLRAAHVDESLVERVGKLIESHAAATLCEPAPLSPANEAFLRKSLAPLRIAA